jgi:hypothetical protein
VFHTISFVVLSAPLEQAYKPHRHHTATTLKGLAHQMPSGHFREKKYKQQPRRRNDAADFYY